MSTAFIESQYDIKVTVFTREESKLPLKTNEQPFIWDKWHWNGTSKTDNIATIPMIYDPDVSFIKRNFWQSGIGDMDDCILLNILEKNIGDNINWYVSLNHGFYFIGKDQYYLYSSNTIIDTVTTNLNISSKNYSFVFIKTDINGKYPISCTQYQRFNNKIKINNQAVHRGRFSGIVINNVEQPTNASSTLIYPKKINDILWNNVNNKYVEFLLLPQENTPLIIFNQDIIQEVGDTSALSGTTEEVAGIIKARYEYIGSGIGDGQDVGNQQLLTEFFPIDNTQDIKLYSIKAIYDPVSDDNILEVNEWSKGEITATKIDGFDYSASGLSTREYMIDHDLGIIYFAPSSPSGVPYGLNREETTNSSRKIVPSGTENFFISYFKTYRLQYEPITDDYTTSLFVKGLRPISSPVNSGIISIVDIIPEAERIILNIDKPIINDLSNDIVYGPLSFTNDNAIITAKVINTEGVAISDIPVEFFHVEENNEFNNRTIFINTPVVFTDSLGTASTAISLNPRKILVPNNDDNSLRTNQLRFPVNLNTLTELTDIHTFIVYRELLYENENYKYTKVRLNENHFRTPVFTQDYNNPVDVNDKHNWTTNDILNGVFNSKYNDFIPGINVYNLFQKELTYPDGLTLQNWLCMCTANSNHSEEFKLTLPSPITFDESTQVQFKIAAPSKSVVPGLVKYWSFFIGNSSGRRVYTTGGSLNDFTNDTVKFYSINISKPDQIIDADPLEFGDITECGFINFNVDIDGIEHYAEGNTMFLAIDDFAIKQLINHDEPAESYPSSFTVNTSSSPISSVLEFDDDYPVIGSLDPQYGIVDHYEVTNEFIFNIQAKVSKNNSLPILSNILKLQTAISKQDVGIFTFGPTSLIGFSTIDSATWFANKTINGIINKISGGGN